MGIVSTDRVFELRVVYSCGVTKAAAARYAPRAARARKKSLRKRASGRRLRISWPRAMPASAGTSATAESRPASAGQQGVAAEGHGHGRGRNQEGDAHGLHQVIARQAERLQVEHRGKDEGPGEPGDGAVHQPDQG